MTNEPNRPAIVNEACSSETSDTSMPGIAMTSLDATALQADPTGMSFLHDVIASGGVQSGGKSREFDAPTALTKRRRLRSASRTRRPEAVG